MSAPFQPSRRSLFAILLGGLATLVAALCGSRKASATTVAATPGPLPTPEPRIVCSTYLGGSGPGCGVAQEDACSGSGTTTGCTILTDFPTGRTTCWEIDAVAGRMRTREYDAQGRLLSDLTIPWPPRCG